MRQRVRGGLERLGSPRDTVWSAEGEFFIENKTIYRRRLKLVRRLPGPRELEGCCSEFVYRMESCGGDLTWMVHDDRDLDFYNLKTWKFGVYA